MDCRVLEKLLFPGGCLPQLICPASKQRTKATTPMWTLCLKTAQDGLQNKNSMKKRSKWPLSSGLICCAISLRFAHARDWQGLGRNLTTLDCPRGSYQTGNSTSVKFCEEESCQLRDSKKTPCTKKSPSHLSWKWSAFKFYTRGRIFPWTCKFWCLLKGNTTAWFCKISVITLNKMLLKFQVHKNSLETPRNTAGKLENSLQVCESMQKST